MFFGKENVATDAKENLTQPRNQRENKKIEGDLPLILH